MPKPRIEPLMTIAVFLVGTGACATMKPPAMNNGPVLSSNGVQVAVLRQVCAETMVNAFETFIDETVELQVRNGSPNPVRIHRDKLRLLGPNGGVFTTGASALDFLTVGNGETQTFEVTLHGTRGARLQQSDATRSWRRNHVARSARGVATGVLRPARVALS